MTKTRMEAFSDGVIAIIITIMVLELKVPHGTEWSVLASLWPVFLSYTLSFVNVGIYWNNHHHLIQASKTVDGGVLWANLFLLFWLSLIPFTAAWMGENQFASAPVALYGLVLIMAAIAYFILTLALIRNHGKESPLALAIGKDFKGKISIVIYAIGIALSFWYSYAACSLYALVALMWLVPDRRMEKALQLAHSAPAR